MFNSLESATAASTTTANNTPSSDHHPPSSSTSAKQASANDDPDERSVFVKNVHFKTTVQELKEHFKECGNIVRITIPVDKASGSAKG